MAIELEFAMEINHELQKQQQKAAITIQVSRVSDKNSQYEICL